jgi:hypothetical protein
MISSFRVQNFKCFEDLTLEGLGRVNLIAGANNVGKTALLEALLLDGRRDFAGAIFEVLAQRRQSGQPTVAANVREWLLDEDQSVALNGAFPLTHSLGPHLLRVRGGTIQQFSLQDHLLRLSDYRLSESEQFPDAMAIWQAGLDPEKRDKYWDHLLIEGDQDKILNFLKLVEPRIERLGLLSDGMSFRQPYCAIDSKRFRLSRLGAGMDRLLGIGFGLSFARGDRLLIDEFETGLHYSILDRVWRAVFDTASALDVQVFATTHSLDCLRAFSQVASEHQQVGAYFRLENRQGKLRAVRLEEASLALATEEGLEVR